MFAISDDQHREIERTFSAGRLTPEKHDRCEMLAGQARVFALVLVGSCPPSRERDHALARLEEAFLWAKAALLHNP